jgi:aromatic ring-opening dioxygenase LigB subunit
MVVFQLGTKISAIEKKLGREPVIMEISEWDMNAILKVLASRNRQMYIRIVQELINEAKKEGYEMMIATEKVKVKCPHCKEEVEI